MEGVYMETIVSLWTELFRNEHEVNMWTRKKELCRKRGATIVRIHGKGHIFGRLSYGQTNDYGYLLHLSFIIKQADVLYEEEMVLPYRLLMNASEIIEHKEIPRQIHTNQHVSIPSYKKPPIKSRQQFTYDRLAAVKYAEHWWNSYNPAYKKFEVDCTNYVSQCLRAGGAPMRGIPDQSKGWWYQGSEWSFSWAVAHSLRWYLSGSTEGLQGKEVESASDLHPGDVICYDFQGDGRWDHNTIVVAKDAEGMPLVNAHTDNSRHRYWSYEDSTAWTPDIQYKFFQIGN